jgi:hypothetical protein
MGAEENRRGKGGLESADDYSLYENGAGLFAQKESSVCS